MLINPSPEWALRYYYSNQGLYKRTWPTTPWHHRIYPHKGAALLWFCHLTSMTCIYGTYGWNMMGLWFEIGTRHIFPSFSSSHPPSSSKKNTHRELMLICLGKMQWQISIVHLITPITSFLYILFIWPWVFHAKSRIHIAYAVTYTPSPPHPYSL